ncbi:hypothetical protein SEA_GILGAMESH_86 [Streptomyces phage Gilgamesh]|uniref:Uncharacterized protein n=1 Tax=Streptomyces phage Gilgamesh TaxID=2599890 RepID=A0A5J6TSC6_9CAUD|nr:hypothetical protein QEH35_gp086 [Streptomyces phage Gilgamesh]QFG13278.1 hypothetical protein SEA_GILGAMESH_86 [Streptomyces phage Gilgamesh]
MTTRSSSLGSEFSYACVAESWYGHINNGERTAAQESAIVDALVDAQVEEFEARLPESHFWLIQTSELQYPADDDTEVGDLDEIRKQSVEAVCNRLPQIEAEALAALD